MTESKTETLQFSSLTTKTLIVNDKKLYLCLWVFFVYGTCFGPWATGKNNFRFGSDIVRVIGNFQNLQSFVDNGEPICKNSVKSGGVLVTRKFISLKLTKKIVSRVRFYLVHQWTTIPLWKKSSLGYVHLLTNQSPQFAAISRVTRSILGLYHL